MDKFVRAYLKQPCLFDFQYRRIEQNGHYHNEFTDYIPCQNAIVYTDMVNYKELSNHLYGRKNKYVVLIEVGDGSLPQWHFSRCIQRVYQSNINHVYPRYEYFPFGILSNHWTGLHRSEKSTYRENRVLVAFNRVTYHFRNQYWANICQSMPDLVDARFPVDYNEFYELLWKYKYVAAPRGNGIDTYRNYEALHCGAIPIVMPNLVNKLSPFQKIFATTNFAISQESFQKQISNLKYVDNELLHCDYWYKQLKRWI